MTLSEEKRKRLENLHPFYFYDLSVTLYALLYAREAFGARERQRALVGDFMIKQNCLKELFGNDQNMSEIGISKRGKNLVSIED